MGLDDPVARENLRVLKITALVVLIFFILIFDSIIWIWYHFK